MKPKIAIFLFLLFALFAISPVSNSFDEREFPIGSVMTFTQQVCKTEGVCGTAKILETGVRFLCDPGKPENFQFDCVGPLVRVEQNGKTFWVNSDWLE
ncbi:MAG: hypothetical protein WC878_04545 [Candidatus Paceibacterota bacterium]